VDGGVSRAAIPRLSADPLQGDRPGAKTGVCASPIHQKALLQTRYGTKRLTKVQRALERKQKLSALRYHKSYPGEMLV
jgi:hypothetical protein